MKLHHRITTNPGNRCSILHAGKARMTRLAATAALAGLCLTHLQARMWSSSDGAKTFEGELKSYDAATGTVIVTMAGGKVVKFPQDKLSAADIEFVKENGKADKPGAAGPGIAKSGLSDEQLLTRADGKDADKAKPVQVFILLGQSNMVGLGKVKGGDGSLEFAVKEKKKYPYLVQDDGAWVERKDVRFVQYMSGKGPLRNEWMTVTGGNLGPEYGLGTPLGNAIEAPVMLVKACIGNRALGWDLLPPGSEQFEFTDSKGVTWVHPGYKGSPERWKKGEEPKPIGWYAGKQWDDDMADAKKALSDLEKHYPGGKGYEVAGFFFWQGERDGGSEALASRYEQNLVHFIKTLRTEFKCPDAKFVLGTMGESVKGSGGNGGKVLEAHLNVDGASGKYPEFKGNVATIYTHPMAQGGSGNGHYGGKAEVYMDVGEAMGKAMVKLLKGGK